MKAKPARRTRNPGPGAIHPAPHLLTPEQIRTAVASRSRRCTAGCQGWDIFETSEEPQIVEIEACDECNRLAERAGEPTFSDADFAILPEAQAALAAAQAAWPEGVQNPPGAPALTEGELVQRFRELIRDRDPASMKIAEDLLLEQGKTLVWASNALWKEEEIYTSGIGTARFGGQDAETQARKIYMAGFFPLDPNHYQDRLSVGWTVYTHHHADNRVVTYEPELQLAYEGAQWIETTKGPSMPVRDGRRAVMRYVIEQLVTDAENGRGFLPPVAGRGTVLRNTAAELVEQLVKDAWQTVATFKKYYGNTSVAEVMFSIREFDAEDAPPPELLKFGGSVVRPNPAWVTHTLADVFQSLASQVPPQWLPKFDQVRGGPKATLVATLKEYGCGAYGCVLPTLDPATVLKVTTDDTEAQFASQLAADLVAPICVEYYMAVSLAAMHDGRPIYLLWREGADDVGKLDKVVGVDAAYYVDEQHKAAQAAYLLLQDRDASGLAAWEAACQEMGDAIPELASLAQGLLKIYREQRIFIGDVHGGNIGRVFRGGETGEWVVTDPGHVAVLDR